ADRLEAQLRAALARVNGLWAHLEEGQGPDEVTKQRDQLYDEVQGLRAEMGRLQAAVRAEQAKASHLWAEIEDAQGPAPDPDPVALGAITRERDALRDEVRRLRDQLQEQRTAEVDVLRTQTD
ncbi:MAG TPA: hypothetical protein VF590_12380, partial [Isosphaeraceae bacterium]